MKYFYYILILFCIITNTIFPQISSQTLDAKVTYVQQYDTNQLNSHQNTFSDFARIQLGIHEVFAEKEEERSLSFDFYFLTKKQSAAIDKLKTDKKFSDPNHSRYNTSHPYYILNRQLLL